MKLISYTHQEVVRYGVLVAQGVADMRLGQPANYLKVDLPIALARVD
jgi:hypothetical protein